MASQQFKMRGLQYLFFKLENSRVDVILVVEDSEPARDSH